MQDSGSKRHSIDARRYSMLTLYRRLFDLARPYRLHLAGIMFLSLLSTPLALLAPVPLKIVVDSVIGDSPLPGWALGVLPFGHGRGGALAVAVVVLLGIALLSELRGMASWVLQTYTTQQLLLHFRARLFAHVQRLSLTYHDRHGSSDSTYRIQYDAQSVPNLTVNGIVPFVTAGVTLVAMMLVMVRLDSTLAVVAVVITPVLFWLARRSSAELRGQWALIKEADSSSMSVVQEVLGSLRVVKAFGQEERERDRFVQYSSRMLSGETRLARTQSALSAAIGMTVASGSAAALYLGASHVRSGMLSVGELFVIMAYMARLFAPVLTITKRTGQLQGAIAGATRAFSVLDEVPEVVERPTARPIERAAGAVRFEHVSFGYEAGQSVLHDVSFDIRPGSRVGIAGATGAGKTTLINLLTRMYDPGSGAVVLDGVDIRDYKLDELRRQFGIVLQEPVLFSTTLAENISYARPDATHEEIVAAAKAADAHTFIADLPDGYDTLVGERGFRLSGGERQRVSLARAFLKDAPILILDEPTSSVDVDTEAVIMDAIQRLMQGRTTFMIAHRLSTLDICDERLTFANGRLIDHSMALQPTAGLRTSRLT